MVYLRLGKATVTGTSDLYTVAGSKELLVSKLALCNTGGDTVVFSVYIDIDGTADDNSDLIYYEISLDANDTKEVLVGYTIDSGKHIIVKKESGTGMTASLWGNLTDV